MICHEEKEGHFTKCKHRKKCLIYPTNKWLKKWDMTMIIVLIITLILSPIAIAFDQVADDIGTEIVLYSIDMLFLLDIFVIFGTAFQGEDLQIEDDRKQIACTYIKSWFLVDVVSIFPFDVIMHVSVDKNYNSLIRFAKLGRLYKLVKLTRLIKMLRMMRE
jgi:hyperpolarization activated cyclic nucleotide-gated potassium channel 2